MITGGEIIAVGSSSMAQNFGTSSTQYSFLYGFSQMQKQGSSIILTDSEGVELFQYTPQKDYQSVLISLPELKEDTIYYLTSGENEKVEITLESTISNIGIKGFGIGGMGRPENRGNGEMPQMPQSQEGMEAMPQRPERGDRGLKGNKEMEIPENPSM